MSIFVLSDPPFNWCRLKLARAHEHMDTFNSDLAAWKKTNPGYLVPECNADATRHSMRLRITNPPKLDRWTTIAADCFHNFRAALDQFLYAVAIFQSKTNPPPNAKALKALQLPICNKPDQFREQQGRIKFLSDPVRTAIEGIQPYKRQHPDLPPLLSLLRDFDNADKHRLPQLTLIHQVGGEFEGLSGIAEGQRVKIFVNEGSIDDGAELAALVLDRPTPNVHYQAFRVRLRVAVRHSPGLSGDDKTALEALFNVISTEVDEVMWEIYKVL